MTMSDELSQSCACPQKQCRTLISGSERNCWPVEEGLTKGGQYELYGRARYSKARTNLYRM